MSPSSPIATPWYSERLSPEQQQAIHSAQKTSVILASAGSGKTRTLVHAIADELLRGTPPEHIVAFTFTKKAAQELQTRVHLLTLQVAPDKDPASLNVGTIHSWCFEFLLGNPEFYNFSALDEDIQLYALIARLYDTLDLQNVYNQPFPRAIRPFMKDLEIYYNEHIPLADVPGKIRDSIGKFETALRQNRLMTFGSMVRDAVNALKKLGPVAGLQKLFVDEYQDVNPAQVELIRAMLPADANVVVVGDDLQCIFNWRGSDVAQILHFADNFKTISPSVLSENYRSRPRLVLFSNDVARNVVTRFKKSMVPTRQQSDASGVFYHSFISEEEQARAIADLVLQFHSTGLPYRNIAILLRSVISAGPMILDALTARGVPVDCPLQRDCGSFIEDFVITIIYWLQHDHSEPRSEQEEADAKDRADALWKAVKPWTTGVASNPASFWARLAEWSGSVRANASVAYNVRGQLYDFISFCGISVDSSHPQLAVALGISSQIIRAVEEIHRRRLVGSPRKSAKNLMREVYYALCEYKDVLGESSPVESPSDAVVVTTVHKAKGLEWPVVILPTLNKHRFPLKNSQCNTSFDPKITLRYGTTFEDEWRLFYVAASRAKERLFMFDFAAGHPEMQSPFVQALAKSLQRSAPEGLTWESEIVRSLSDKEISQSEEPSLRLALSDVLIYTECPYQYALRRITGIQPAIADTLGYGQSVHEIAQRRSNDGKEWTSEQIDSAVERYIHLPYVGEKQLNESKIAIKARVGGLQKAGAFAMKSLPEIDVEISFDKGIVFGIVDSIVTAPAGDGVRDWKTNIHSEFLSRYEDQLRFYVHALRNKGRTVVTADLIDIGSTFEAGELKSLPVDISVSQVAKTISSIETAVNGIAERRFDPTPSKTICAGCDLRTVCAYRGDDAKTH
jgi:DNA helicase II / ATP-dependent DNA helicase PcrA